MNELNNGNEKNMFFFSPLINQINEFNYKILAEYGAFGFLAVEFYEMEIFRLLAIYHMY